VAPVRVLTYAERPDRASADSVGRRARRGRRARAYAARPRGGASRSSTARTTGGDYVVPGALVPVSFADGHGVYVEPNVWMRHAAAQ